MAAPPARRLPSIKQLRYFVALAEQRHFGRAAAQCFVSQSAFSVAIQELETLLGANLVDRTNRRVTITATGREVAALAKSCLDDLQALVEVARGRGGPLKGPLALGIIPTIAPFLLPRLLPALKEEFPDLELVLHEATTEQLHEQLLKGALDAVLLALPYELEGVESLELFRDRFLLAARRGTRLVDPRNYQFSKLDPRTVLLLREEHCLREHAIEACRLRDPEKLSRLTASTLLTLIEMVDADLGITFLPEMAVGSELLKGTRVETHPLGDGSYRTIAIVWRRGSGRAQEFRMLGDFVKRVAAAAPSPRRAPPAARPRPRERGRTSAAATAGNRRKR
ncbi:MAG TPA: hydrogen peroxide-inducible genes activator [Gammaproteobacteria bacterium]